MHSPHTPTDIWLIRHGETEANASGRLQGQTDTPLSARGRDQAAQLAARLARLARHAPFAALYTSDLQRAAQTAAIIGQALGLEPHPDSRLREGDLGAWTGKTFEEVRRAFPEECAYIQRTNDPHHPRGGGESYVQMQTRIVAAINEYAARHPGERILVVSHGGVLRTYLAHVLHLPLEHAWRLHLGNTGISRVVFKTRPSTAGMTPGMLMCLNDMAHLEPEEKEHV
ncbi:probable phosphoglycerate mutase [Ardenticatena maritima]|uniref:Probable phosphoglycerate mutase n=1 Tax=Ardenticatena maritima TaxID=872965 RepID=A0A0M9UBV5_9CHLR|nr:histidine phosphatase family protein [Ardenticatena maritima]KPL87816.1 hypothetical protein SE16_09650 [Ardenticatena maritima]GAP62180.1 probable phosphoglycerate mutase [Ardenticatena maritima]